MPHAKRHKSAPTPADPGAGVPVFAHLKLYVRMEMDLSVRIL